MVNKVVWVLPGHQVVRDREENVGPREAMESLVPQEIAVNLDQGYVRPLLVSALLLVGVV